jgi:O-acetyl-ADP-ribose deacetylase (regulator of RNase III)
MSVTFIRGDITKLKVDAIVNAANNELRGGGGVDGAIHAAAGAEQLHAFCKTLGGCPTGEAKLSPGFNLLAKYIIHTVGPVWRGGAFHEKTLLTSCYIRSLELAKKQKCKTVAFPLISAGAYGYPYEDALQIAHDACQRFLHETKANMDIYIVLYQRGRNYNTNIRRNTAYSESPDENTFQHVAEYIRDHYHFDAEETERAETAAAKETPAFDSVEEAAMGSASAMASAQSVQAKEATPFFAKMRRQYLDDSMPMGKSASCSRRPSKEDFPVEETFSRRLERFMGEKKMSSPQLCFEACIDRKLLSKILCNINYQPTKNTAVRLALGLKLSPEETDSLLNAAGLALSRSKHTDLVIAYCISHNLKALWQVNDILEEWGLNPI